MFTVAEITPAVQRVLGTCDDATLLEQINARLTVQL